MFEYHCFTPKKKKKKNIIVLKKRVHFNFVPKVRYFFNGFQNTSVSI